MAGMAQLIECRPVNQRIASSIPSQGTCLDRGHARGNHTLMFLSLFPPVPSLEINRKRGEEKESKSWALSVGHFQRGFLRAGEFQIARVRGRDTEEHCFAKASEE